MKVWLVTIGEPVPVQEGRSDRLHRTGYLANFLAEHGHRVTWWTSTFDHFRKKHWFLDDQSIKVNDLFEIELLHGCGYKRHVSWARFQDHRQIAWKFAKKAAIKKERPDIILASLPTIELCTRSIRYGRKFGIPVVLDMRDMWPDIFVEAVPKLLRPLGRIFLSPLFSQAAQACAQATAIIGITDAFVEWGLHRGGRQPTHLDRSFSMGYVSSKPAAEELKVAELFWDQKGITHKCHDLVICFAGTIGVSCVARLEPVIKAVQKVASQGGKIKLIICGSGERLAHLQGVAQGDSNIVFTGWVNRAAIYVLMRRSNLGINPLLERFDFLATINNKAVEYMSAGLPVISSPKKGVLAQLLAKEQCGLSFNCSDPEELIALLNNLIEKPERFSIMSHNSLRVFQERFNADKVYSEMMSYLDEVLNSVKSGVDESVNSNSLLGE